MSTCGGRWGRRGRKVGGNGIQQRIRVVHWREQNSVGLLSGKRLEELGKGHHRRPQELHGFRNTLPSPTVQTLSSKEQPHTGSLLSRWPGTDTATAQCPILNKDPKQYLWTRDPSFSFLLWPLKLCNQFQAGAMLDPYCQSSDHPTLSTGVSMKITGPKGKPGSCWAVGKKLLNYTWGITWGLDMGKWSLCSPTPWPVTVYINILYFL